jgi:AcrR family transcriptional regulator
VGSLYQYFSSKQQLVSALLNQHIEHTMHELRSALPELSLLSLAEAVPRFVELMIASHRVEPELHRVFYEQLPRVGDFASMEASVRESQQLTEAYLRARAHEITPQDHAMSAFILVHTIETLTHAAVLSRPEMLKTDAFANELSELVLRYLQPGRSKVRKGS